MCDEQPVAVVEDALGVVADAVGVPHLWRYRVCAVLGCRGVRAVKKWHEKIVDNLNL